MDQLADSCQLLFSKQCAGCCWQKQSADRCAGWCGWWLVRGSGSWCWFKMMECGGSCSILCWFLLIWWWRPVACWGAASSGRSKADECGSCWWWCSCAGLSYRSACWKAYDAHALNPEDSLQGVFSTNYIRVVSDQRLWPFIWLGV